VDQSYPNDTLPAAAVPPAIDVELLALDLTACTRCVGSLANIEAAVAAVRPVLEATGARVTVSKRIVASEEEARRLRFVSSPTIRVNGRDIAPELLESPCQSCTDLCGCADGTSCRVWQYRGEEYPEAPVGLIIESVLRAVLADDGRSHRTVANVPEVPDNLRRFFHGKAARPPAAPCCSTAERATCCDADQKEGCCHDSQPTACGCR
jgi:hypothetical protein